MPPGNDKILIRESTLPQVARAKLLAVFGALDSLDKRRLASGNEPDDQIGRYAKRGWALRRVEHAQTTARARAHIKDAPAALERSAASRLPWQPGATLS